MKVRRVVTGHDRSGVLRPGDTVVQNGTRHRWGNRGTEPAVLAVFMVGAHRAGNRTDPGRPSTPDSGADDR